MYIYSQTGENAKSVSVCFMYVGIHGSVWGSALEGVCVHVNGMYVMVRCKYERKSTARLDWDDRIDLYVYTCMRHSCKCHKCLWWLCNPHYIYVKQWCMTSDGKGWLRSAACSVEVVTYTIYLSWYVRMYKYLFFYTAWGERPSWS